MDPKLAVELEVRLNSLKEAITVTEKLEQRWDRLRQKAAQPAGTGDFGSPFQAGSKAFGRWWNDQDGAQAQAQEQRDKQFREYEKRQKAAQDRAESLRKQAADTETELAQARAREQRVKIVERFNKSLDEKTERLLNPPPVSSSGDGGVGGGFGLGRFMGYGAAALGIGSIFGFIGAARNAARNDLPLRAQLGQRGIDNLPSYLGYNTTEAKQIALQLAQVTGYRGVGGRDAARSVMEFSRATGTDASFGISQMAGWRETLNAGPERQRKTLELLAVIAKNTGDSVERVSRVLNANYGMMTAAQGGMELSPLQQSRMSNITEMLFGLGPVGRNPATMQSLMNMFRPSGNRYYDINRLTSMGATRGPWDHDKIAEMRNLTAEGVTTPQGKKILDNMVTREFGSLTGPFPEGKLKNFLHNLMPQLGEGSGADFARIRLFSTINDPKFNDTAWRDKQIDDIAGKSPYMKMMLEKWLKTGGAGVKSLEAEKWDNEVKMGKLMYESFGKLEHSINKLVAGLIDSGFAEKAKEAAQIFSQAVAIVVDNLPEKKIKLSKHEKNMVQWVARETGLNERQSEKLTREVQQEDNFSLNDVRSKAETIRRNQLYGDAVKDARRQQEKLGVKNDFEVVAEGISMLAKAFKKLFGQNLEVSPH